MIKTIRIPILIALTFLIVIFLIRPGILSFLGRELLRGIPLRSRMDKIIYQTDHPALLTACRMLIKQGYRGKYIFDGDHRHPDVIKFPKEIRDLRPVYVKVFDDRVHIEFFGGLNFCRLIAFSEDFKEPYAGYIYGEKRLIDGLWLDSDLMDFK